MISRKPVLQFAESIEERLQHNDARYGRYGWRDGMTMLDLLARLHEEVCELHMAVKEDESLADIAREASDVGALAMMIHDLTLDPANSPTEEAEK